MKTLLILIAFISMHHATASDNMNPILEALTYADKFDSLYGDTVSEGDVGKIEPFKAFTVTFNPDEELSTITLINDYKTIEGESSTLQGVAQGYDLDTDENSWTDLKTHKSL